MQCNGQTQCQRQQVHIGGKEFVSSYIANARFKEECSFKTLEITFKAVFLLENIEVLFKTSITTYSELLLNTRMLTLPNLF